MADVSGDIGELRQRITIQSATRARDAHGQWVNTYATLVSRWAEVIPLDGRELEKAKALDASVTHRVKMRYYASLTPRMRIVHKTRTLEVVSVLNTDERRIRTVAYCVEAV